MIVAIDGPAGSGKSTTARGVAERLGYLYLDTGAMYRAVALAFLQAGREATPEDAKALLPTLRIDVGYDDGEMRVVLNGDNVSDEIRQPEVGTMASRVSALPSVRDKLVAEQRRIGRAQARQGGVVLDGRDIGTIVFPDADLKVFMVADPAVRARRRQAELAERGIDVAFDDVLAEIQQRDRDDQERAVAPLRKAEDALELDTTHRTIEEQVAWVVDRVRERQKAPDV